MGQATTPGNEPGDPTGIREGLYHLLFESASDGICILRGPVVIDSNRRAAELFGCSCADLIGMTPADLSPLLQPCGARSADLAPKRIDAARRERPFCFDWVHQRADGTPFDAEISLTAVEVDGDEYTLAIIRDVSERLRLEQEAETRHQQLLQADKMASLGVLVSGVAHEINNPNGLIKSSLHILRPALNDIIPALERCRREHGDFMVGGLPVDELRDALPALLADMQRGADRIAGIVGELRDFARQQPDDLAEDVDLNAVVQAAATLLANIIKKSTNHFELRLGSDLPPVNGHFQRLEQVVVNLLVNACQALTDPDQAIVVETRQTRQANIAEIIVRDEGRGIGPEDVRRITDPFFTTKRDTGGTGLGLSVSSRIISEHNGKLLFNSAPDRGMTATIQLPLHP